MLKQYLVAKKTLAVVTVAAVIISLVAFAGAGALVASASPEKRGRADKVSRDLRKRMKSAAGGSVGVIVQLKGEPGRASTVRAS